MLRLSLFTAFLLAAPLASAQAPADAFFDNLRALCGQAFEGEVVHAPEGDTTFADQELVMHVRACGPDEIRVPFHVGENRSRTWVFTRTEDGVRLKHDHRHADGTEEDVTQYGGDSAPGSSAERQIFPADRHTAELLPYAATNVWMVELERGDTFVYSLYRLGTDRRFRIAFDLSETVQAPPAPWGFEGDGY